MTITAKFPSKCSVCGDRIARGDKIEWTRGSREVHHSICVHGSSEPRAVDGDDDRIEDDDTPERAKYDTGRYVSNVTTFSSGATVYTNRRGRCEDAPCCGCCT